MSERDVRKTYALLRQERDEARAEAAQLREALLRYDLADCREDKRGALQALRAVKVQLFGDEIQKAKRTVDEALGDTPG